MHCKDFKDVAAGRLFSFSVLVFLYIKKPASSYIIFSVCVCLCVCYFSVCVPYLWWLGSICVDLTEEIPRLIALSCLACINLLNRAKTLVQKYQLYQPMPSRIQKPHTTSQEHNKRTNIKGQAYCFYSKFKWECLSFVTSRQTSHCSSVLNNAEMKWFNEVGWGKQKV